jgi:hypothetical protein
MFICSSGKAAAGMRVRILKQIGAHSFNPIQNNRKNRHILDPDQEYEDLSILPDTGCNRSIKPLPI